MKKLLIVGLLIVFLLVISTGKAIFIENEYFSLNLPDEYNKVDLNNGGYSPVIPLIVCNNQNRNVLINIQTQSTDSDFLSYFYVKNDNLSGWNYNKADCDLGLLDSVIDFFIADEDINKNKCKENKHKLFKLDKGECTDKIMYYFEANDDYGKYDIRIYDNKNELILDPFWGSSKGDFWNTAFTNIILNPDRVFYDTWQNKPVETSLSNDGWVLNYNVFNYTKLNTAEGIVIKMQPNTTFVQTSNFEDDFTQTPLNSTYWQQDSSTGSCTGTCNIDPDYLGTQLYINLESPGDGSMTTQAYVRNYGIFKFNYTINLTNAYLYFFCSGNGAMHGRSSIYITNDTSVAYCNGCIQTIDSQGTGSCDNPLTLQSTYNYTLINNGTHIISYRNGVNWNNLSINLIGDLYLYFNAFVDDSQGSGKYVRSRIRVDKVEQFGGPSPNVTGVGTGTAYKSGLFNFDNNYTYIVKSIATSSASVDHDFYLDLINSSNESVISLRYKLNDFEISSATNSVLLDPGVSLNNQWFTHKIIKSDDTICAFVSVDDGISWANSSCYSEGADLSNVTGFSFRFRDNDTSILDPLYIDYASVTENVDYPKKTIYNLTHYDNLILDMPFENDAIDQSGYEYNVISNATYLPTGGVDNRGAYDFNGIDDYIQVGKSSDFTEVCNNGCTFSFWAKVPNSSLGVQSILARYDNTGDNRFYRIRFNDQSITPQMILQMNPNGNSTQYAVGNGLINFDEWEHHTFVYNGSSTYDGSLKAYKNGVFNGSTGSFMIDANSWKDLETTFLGKQDDSSPLNFLNGTIDEMLIFDRDLDDSEILNIYNANGSWGDQYYGIAPFNLILSMPFETENKDQSGYSNDGISENLLYVEGIKGKGIDINNSFGVNSSVIIPYDSSFDLETMSINCWVKPDSFATAGYCFSKRRNANQMNYDLSIGVSGKAVFHIERASDDVDFFATSVNNISLNVWTMITGTYDGNSLKIYINGVLDNTNEIGAVVPYTGAGTYPQIAVGGLAQDSGTTNRFLGALDSVSLFRGALPSGKILEMYNAKGSWLYQNIQLSGNENIYTSYITSNQSLPDRNSSIKWARYNFGGFDDFKIDKEITLTNYDLISNYPFDNNLYDLSGYNIKIKNTGATFNATGGVNGNGSYRFNGLTNYMTLLDDETPKTMCNNGCSVCTWFNAEAFITNRVNELVGRWSNTDDDQFFRLLITKNSDTPQFILYEDGGSSNSSASATGSVANETYYHLCGVYNGGADYTGITKIYVNGVLNGTGGSIQINSTAWADPENITIGAIKNGAVNPYFKGRLDEILLFDRPLNDSQVLDIYNGGGNWGGTHEYPFSSELFVNNTGFERSLIGDGSVVYANITNCDVNGLCTTTQTNSLYVNTNLVLAGDIYNPPGVSWYYNITENFEVNSPVVVNDTCIVIDGSIWNGTYCYDHQIYINNGAVFPNGSAECFVNITNVGHGLGEQYDLIIDWYNSSNEIMQTDNALCDDNSLCEASTLNPDLIKQGDKINCIFTWNGTSPTFFTFSNTSENVTISEIGLCSGANIYPYVNISFFDQITDENISVNAGIDLLFTEGTATINYENNYTNVHTIEICTSVNPAEQTIEAEMYGDIFANSQGYVSKVINIIEGFGVNVSNNPPSQYDVYLISLDNSSTLQYTWQTTEFQLIDGTMLVYECNEDSTRTLIESTIISNGIAFANLQLFTQAYSYEVIIDGTKYTDSSYTDCRIENDLEHEFYVDLGLVDVLPVIGLFLLDCTLEQLGENIVKMTWGSNTEDDSDIEACIIGKRQTLTGLQEIYRDCVNQSSGTFTRTIPDNGNSYYVTGELFQNDIKGYCQQTISFYDAPTTPGLLGITGLFCIVFIIMGMALFYAGQGELQIAAGVGGLILAFLIGIIALPWEAVISIVLFCGIIALIGRYSKKRTTE